MKNLFLRLGLKLIGIDVFKEYRELKKIEYDSLEENKNRQKQKLIKLLIYSYRNVPYYQKILKEANVINDDLQVNLMNWSKIPILTKNIIRQNFENLKIIDLDKKKWFYNTSGGSTGEPVRLIQDNYFLAKCAAVKWLFFSFIDDFPCRQISLWGSERDILKGGYGLAGHFKNWIYQRKFLNSFRMNERNMYRYVQIINRYRPKIIEAYVQSIYQLSGFIKEHNLDIYSPEGILTSAGTLYPQMKDLVEEVFKTKVFNRYGSREVGDMACSCERQEGLHVNILSYYFEILNDKLEPCRPGETGRVYVTALDNYVMPLIRYDIGDMAVPSENEKCPCGRGFPLIKSIKGRDVNLFKNKNKDLIDGEYFTHLFYLKKWVKNFQVIQKDYELIICNIVLNGREDKRDTKVIENSITKVMGGECKIIWNFVDKINPLNSGKYVYTISEIK